MAAAAARTEYNLRGLPYKLTEFFKRYPPNLYSARATGVTLPLTRKEAKEAAILKNELKKQGQDGAVQEQTRTTEPDTTATATTISAGEATVVEATVPTTAPVTSTLESSDPQPAPSITSNTPPLAAEDLLSTTTETPSSSITSDPAPPTSIDGAPLTLNSRLIDGLTRATRFPSNPFLPFKNPVTGRWASPRFSLRRQADLCKLARKYDVEDLLPPSRKSLAFKEARILQRGLRVKGTGEGQRVKGHKWERMLPMALQARTEALQTMPALIREWEAKGHGRGWKKWPKAKAR